MSIWGIILHAEPKIYNGAVIGKDSEKWIQAIREELATYKQNRMWDITLSRP